MIRPISPDHPQLHLLKFRWEQTHESAVDFSPGLVILHGKTQAERTVALRLIRYALGGNANRIDNEDMGKSTLVKLRVRINGQLIDISRSCRDVREKVLVQEWNDNEPFSDAIAVDKLSGYLMDKLGLPLVHMARVRNGKQIDVPLSFNDLDRAVFIDRDISYVDILGEVPDPTRREIVRVLLGLTTREIADAESRRRQLEAEKRALEQSISAIRMFLRDLNVPTLGEIEKADQQLRGRLLVLDNEEQALRDQVRQAAAETADPQSSEGYEKTRTELMLRRKAIDGFQRELLDITHHQTDKADLRLELEAEVNRLNRQLSSQHIISTFTFSQCPRCLLQITEDMRRREKSNKCMLCGRGFLAHVHDNKGWEKVLRDSKQTIKEVDELLQQYEERKVQIQDEVNTLTNSITWLEQQLTSETEKYVSPLIEQIRFRAVERMQIERHLSQLEYQKHEREHADQMETMVLPQNEKKLENLARELERLRQELGSERDRYDAFLAHFRHFMKHVDLDRPFYGATWNERDQVPNVNDQPCKKALAGPDLAVAVLAFHYSLLAMSAHRTGFATNHLKILIIDEPEQQKMGKKRYQQVMNLFGKLAIKHRKRIQIIIATATEDIPKQFESYGVEL